MENLNLKLKIWRQSSPNDKGAFVSYDVSGLNTHMSFLEMLDVLNEKLVVTGDDPVAFDHDCREGICGMCSMVINGKPHGPQKGTTTCQLHMRHFKDGDTVTIEPWRAKPFPVLKDLIVDRSSFDRIIQSGGYISVNTGSAPDGNSLPISKEIAEDAFDAAACIGCGACVAACKNASASLFVSAKVSQLSLLPQGQPEREERVKNMVSKMDEEGFGHCTNTGACEAECPKEISLEYIRKLNWEYHRSNIKG
ncbi:succinate dehydrogenase/fumarate reductase iron-sulfur subunit [Candidatus Marinimicrobia bacterium]|jgi:succinate dehydrogenase / fumarate reductase iron-sulfur subunit|nr:succinate dehydrogenase/fumarate reductase iron-sulfur subunit [Candidatus Neomarinimicrobiota bacterium]